MKILVKERKPVYIAIPLDIATIEISDKDVSYDWESDSENLQIVATEIATKINSSKSPIILGDLLIKRFDTNIEYKEFVEKARIPVTNFLMGTNLIDMDYDLYLGGYYSKYKNPEAESLINNTDCLIAIGPVYTDLNASGFNLPYKINEHIAVYGTYTYVEGKKYDNVKMADVLDSVTKLIDSKDIKIKKTNIGYESKQAENKPLTSEYIYPRLQEFIKENDILLAETGIIPQGIVTMKFPPAVDIQTQTLWGSIGWATPATLGVCCAKPNSRVILVTGEGSHQLTAMEIGTMLRFGLKPIVIVLNNGGYTVERLLSNSPDDKFNDIMQMNYSKFARIFEGDVWSTKVTTEEDFDKALKVTQIMDKLCYIEICTGNMDMPNLTKEIISNLRHKEGNTDKKETSLNIEKNITETISNNVCNSFETVVHRGIGEF